MPPSGLGKLQSFRFSQFVHKPFQPPPSLSSGIKPVLDGIYPSQEFLSRWDGKPVNSSHCHMGRPGSLGKVQSVALRQLMQRPGNTSLPDMVFSSLISSSDTKLPFPPREGGRNGRKKVTSWAIFYLIVNPQRIDRARSMPVPNLKAQHEGRERGRVQSIDIFSSFTGKRIEGKDFGERSLR